MKKKVAILGSTGSIGKSTLEVIKKDKKNFEILLLTANNNYKLLIKQAKEFKVKNVLIKNTKFHLKVENSLKRNKVKVYSGNIPLNNSHSVMDKPESVNLVRPPTKTIKTIKKKVANNQ